MDRLCGGGGGGVMNSAGGSSPVRWVDADGGKWNRRGDEVQVGGAHHPCMVPMQDGANRRYGNAMPGRYYLRKILDAKENQERQKVTIRQLRCLCRSS